MNRNSFFILISLLAVLLLSACDSKTANSKDQIEHFSTKDKALQFYINNEKVTGKIELVTTTSGDQLLVTQESKDTFFVGEFNKDHEGYYAVKLSNSTWIHPDALGMGWVFSTMEGNKYTIYFKKVNDNNYVPFPNSDYFFSISKGDTISKFNNNTINAIQKVE